MNHYQRIYKTINEMMLLRGATPHPSFVNPTQPDDLERKNMILHYLSPENETIVILFADSGLGKGQIQTYASQFMDLSANKGIIVVDSSGIKKAISSIAENSLRTLPIPVEVFADHELITNILGHELQPKFEIVKGDDKNIVYQTFATPDKLPKLRHDDPVARFIGCKMGDIIKTTQYVETGGEEIGYLTVV